jgi:hypothetical protein
LILVHAAAWFGPAFKIVSVAAVARLDGLSNGNGYGS